MSGNLYSTEIVLRNWAQNKELIDLVVQDCLAGRITDAEAESRFKSIVTLGAKVDPDVLRKMYE